MTLRNRRLISLIVSLILLIAAALPASAGRAGGKFGTELNAQIVNCSVVITFVMPPPVDQEPPPQEAKLPAFARGPVPLQNTVYVFVFDEMDIATQLAVFEVTGNIGEAQSVIFNIEQLYQNEDIGIYLAATNEPGVAFLYQVRAPVEIPDEVADACIQEQIAQLDCPYPPTPLLGQGRVIVPTLSYWAPRLDAETIPPVILPVGTSWWILEARDGFYKLFIACQGRYVWVTAEALGANFDVVWGGRPLPDAGEPAN